MAEQGLRTTTHARRRDPPIEASAQRHAALDRRAANQPAAGYGALLNARPSGAGPVQRAAPANRTGLPDRLKAGVEALSGLSMNGVKVHYGSSRPAELGAHAYAQGSDIHLAPGQEKHLPHEAWHLVQQAQGRVRPTMQMKSGVPVNDDAALEREADMMGARAMTAHLSARAALTARPDAAGAMPVQRVATFGYPGSAAFSVAQAVDDAIAAGSIGADKRADAIAHLNAGNKFFAKRSAFLNYIGNRFPAEDSDEEEGEEEEAEAEAAGTDSDEDEEEAAARANEGFGKEDHTADKRVGKGRKSDSGTPRFKNDQNFRAWVHSLKQHNKLEQYGVANRQGGDDNIDNADLRKLEAAYDRELAQAARAAAASASKSTK